MEKKLMIEELNRIKSLMGILKEDKSESDKRGFGLVPDYEYPNIFKITQCYPSDYEPGKKYGREELAKIFSCFAGERLFPVDGVKEMFFPLIPSAKKGGRHIEPSYDPENMQMGENKYYTMKEWVDEQKSKYSDLSLETISISPDQIHPDTIEFIPKKETAINGEERIKFQMKRALKDGVESLTDNEPFVVEVKDGLYKWHEGWNRMIALKRLCEQGKIPEIKGKAWVAHGIK